LALSVRFPNNQSGILLLLDTVSRMNIPLGIARYISEDSIKTDLKGIM